MCNSKRYGLSLHLDVRFMSICVAFDKRNIMEMNNQAFV